MKKNSKSAKTVSSPATTENPSNTSSASEAEDIKIKRYLQELGTGKMKNGSRVTMTASGGR